MTVSAGLPLTLIFAVGTGQALGTEFFLFEDRPSVSMVCSWFVLTGPDGCRETIIVNGRQVTLQAGTKTAVDLSPARP